MKIKELITADTLQVIQDILSLDLKPDSFNAETSIARGYPGATKEGSLNTLVDVKLRKILGLDIKCKGSIKVLKRKPKKGEFWEYDGKYIVTPESTMCITRRPNIDCFDCSAEEGINNSLERMVEFYEKSLRNSDCTDIKSLLIQHSWSKDRHWTVFNFSLMPHKIPEVARFEKTDRNVLRGYDREGNLVVEHSYFTRGSQNFSTRYYRSLDDYEMIIEPKPRPQTQLRMEDLNGFVFWD